MGHIVASTLTMDNATYGRSATGRKKLQNALTEDFNKMKDVLSGTEYQNVKAAVNKYWSGTDAQDFLADIDKTRDSILKAISKIKADAVAALDAEALEFDKFQFSQFDTAKTVNYK